MQPLRQSWPTLFNRKLSSSTNSNPTTTPASPSPAQVESSFNQTLQFITSIKLQELDKQRLAHHERAKIIEQAKVAGIEDGILKRVEVLAEAIKKWSGSGALDPKTRLVGNELYLGMLDFWLQQAKMDPSFNLEAVERWIRFWRTVFGIPR